MLRIAFNLGGGDYEEPTAQQRCRGYLLEFRIVGYVLMPERVAQTYAFFAFVCGSSSFSSSGINRYTDIFILRTAEEFVSERNTTALQGRTILLF